MNRTATHLRTATIFSGLLVLPLIVLELTNRRGFGETFPYPLFAVLWLLPAVFVLTLLRIVRRSKDTDRESIHPASWLARITFLVLLAALWIGLMRDQMLCFLGVPNCD